VLFATPPPNFVDFFAQQSYGWGNERNAMLYPNAFAHAMTSLPDHPPAAVAQESLIASIRRRDPASTSWLQVVLCNPGLHALLLYRVANRLWRWGLHFPAKLLTYLTRMVTGIEIHPAATIGRNLLIDHGSGVVIGETAEIGDDVLLYQGVTLGGTSRDGGKRHPTLGDHVVVGAGAKVLGAIHIGAHSRIGANAVVLADAPNHSVIVGVPGRVVCQNGKPTTEAPLDLDPSVADALPQAMATMQKQLADMQRVLTLAQQRLQQLEQTQPTTSAAPVSPATTAGQDI
jgi:serine O-acetyltransferase